MNSTAEIQKMSLAPIIAACCEMIRSIAPLACRLGMPICV